MAKAMHPIIQMTEMKTKANVTTPLQLLLSKLVQSPKKKIEIHKIRGELLIF